MNTQGRVLTLPLIRLADAVEPQEIVEVTLAMVMMQEFDPQRFRSDKAFRTQLVRRVRGLTEANVRMHFNYRTGKEHRVYSELTPRATETIAQWIVVSIGPAGIQLANLEKEESKQSRAKRESFTESLLSLR